MLPKECYDIYMMDSYLEVLTESIWLIAVIALWDLLWKGIALWKAARKEQKYWYILLLLINSAGIVPIIYLLINKYKEGKK